MSIQHAFARVFVLASAFALIGISGAHTGCHHAGSKTDGVQTHSNSSGSDVVVGTQAGPDFRPPQQQFIIHNGTVLPRPDLEPIADPAIEFDPTLNMTPRPPAHEQPKE